MAVITPVTNTAPGYETTQTDRSSEIRDQFLKMLMAQMQHQDPLNPMETTEFTSQLAQLTNVEQLQDVNKNLGYLQLYMASINNSQSLNFVGKDIFAVGNKVRWDGESPAELAYKLSGNAARVVVNVYDENKQVVRTLHVSGDALDKGQHHISWNGVKDNGEAAAKGTYTFSVLATDTEGNAVEVNTVSVGTVTGLTFEDGVTYVLVNGQKIPIGDIVEIREIELESQAETADEGSGDALDGGADAEENNTGSELADTLKVLGTAAIKTLPFIM